MSMKCPKCNNDNKSEQFFCHHCGELLLKPQLEDEKMEAEFIAKVNELSTILAKVADEKRENTDYLWDMMVAKYARVIENSKEILNSQLMRANSSVSEKLFRDMDKMLERCKTAEFHIALVGTIKAGKSTLINAILGEELTPSDRVTPETASLTKFRGSRDYNYVKVRFYNQSEWQELWQSVVKSKAEVFLKEYKALNADAEKAKWIGHSEEKIECTNIDDLKETIEKWTSSKSAQHYFVKEVEVGFTGFADMPENVVFVDTPGLDDVVAYRSNITRDYIDRANAVLVCVKSDALSGEEMKTITRVFDNRRYDKEGIYIAATQLDTLNNPEKDWKSQREEWIKYLELQNYYETQHLASKNIVPVSAYLYTLLNDFANQNISDERRYTLRSILMKFRCEIDELSESYDSLITFTGIEKLKRKLQTEVINQSKDKIIADIREDYINCKEEIIQTMNQFKQNQVEIIETSQQTKEEIENKRDHYQQQLEQAETRKEQVEDLLKEIEFATTQGVEQLIESIRKIREESNE